MTEYTLPLPDVEDPLTAPFWAAAREGRLVAQSCATCGYLRWPPGPICTECLTPGGEWTEVSPHGTLYSYAEYHRALDPRFAADVPYTVGLVELDEGPRMYGLLRSAVQTADVGRKVRAVFDAVTDQVTFVRWELV
jgi:uncharacterized OB-fold protein